MSKAGKDEFSLGFLEAGFKRLAFGDAVKNEYAEINDLPVEEMYNEMKDFHRPGIIHHGESKRKVNPFHWVDVVKTDLLNDHNENHIILTDIRRIPELQFIKALKDSFTDHVKLYEVIRPLSNGGVFDADVETSHAICYAHYHNLLDGVIFNSSTPEYLFNTANEILEEVGVKENRIYKK